MNPHQNVGPEQWGQGGQRGGPIGGGPIGGVWGAWESRARNYIFPVSVDNRGKGVRVLQMCFSLSVKSELTVMSVYNIPQFEVSTYYSNTVKVSRLLQYLITAGNRESYRPS
jgi:hypothetical protein